MFRPATVVPLLLVGLALGGCSWFASKKQPLPGERISVLSLDRELKPDPNLARIAISLPKPTVNADWPEPGGYPNHAMQHLALPYRLTPAWKVSIGEGSGRYTQVLAQPVVEGGRVYAMDGGSEVGAYAASNGARIWQVDVKPGRHGNSFGGGVAFWKGRLVRIHRLRPGIGARSRHRQGDLENRRRRPGAQRPDGGRWPGLCRDRRKRAGGAGDR